MNRVRSLRSIQAGATLPPGRPAKQRLGVQQPNLIELELDHIIPDELHLLLRVGDILIRNLVFQMVQADRRSARTGQAATHLTTLQRKFGECGVIFRVWETRDSDGKPSGEYDWTSLMGTDMKTVLRRLPSTFPALLSDDLRERFAVIWQVNSLREVCGLTV